jgi:hypothetical protein
MAKPRCACWERCGMTSQKAPVGPDAFAIVNQLILGTVVAVCIVLVSHAPGIDAHVALWGR